MSPMMILKNALSITLMISLSSAGCERSAQPHYERGDDVSAATRYADESSPPQRRPQLRALIAATRATSPLLRGVLQQLRGGEPLGLSLASHIDAAHLAVRDGLILGALSLNLDQGSGQSLDYESASGARLDIDETGRASETTEAIGATGMGEFSEMRVGVKLEELTRYRLASSELWWAHRGGSREITVATWRALITGSRDHWLGGERFQLCLRATPDPLESLWGEAHPELAPALERARASGRWPIFDTDEQLIAHLNAHPGAVALFPVGNLKLWGAPLSQISIRDHRAPRIVASLELLNAPRWSEASRAPTQARLIKRRLRQLIASLLDETERASRVREWGWEP